MEFVCRTSVLKGTVNVPGSKSHTIRGVLLGSLAAGESTLLAPLASADTESAVRVYTGLGARFDCQPGCWRITGLGAAGPRAPAAVLDTGNSGTTLNVALGTLALLRTGAAEITGDAQIQRRPSQPLAAALNDLGASVQAVHGNGCAPFRVRGTLRGGRTRIACPSSQYLTALLLACPLAAGDSEIAVTLLHEQPYVDLTLDWLRRLGVKLDGSADRRHFHVPGGQTYPAFHRRIPADFSTATFFLAAGALGANAITCRGLDLDDAQPDKAVVEYLRTLGARVEVQAAAIAVQPGALAGAELDLNATPDALPMLAVLGCFARGETRLLNVPQARIKETDRIAVMCRELRRLGADIDERPDGLVIRESRLRGAAVDGHGDHRVVMALALAGTLIPGETRVSTAEAAAVTVPGFAAQVRDLGGDLEMRASPG